MFSLQGFSFGTSANPFDGRRRSVRTPGALALLEAPDSVNTPRLPTLWEEPQLLPFDREGGAHPPYATKYISHLQNPRNLKQACAKLAHRCTREGEKATRECVWLRTDLNTTSPFQRAHRLMPHKSLRQKHGPGDECIVGCQKRLKAAARLRLRAPSVIPISMAATRPTPANYTRVSHLHCDLNPQPLHQMPHETRQPR